MLCSEESRKSFKVVRQKNIGEWVRALFQQQKHIKSNMHLSEQSEDIEGQEDVGGKNYINEKMSHCVCSFPSWTEGYIFRNYLLYNCYMPGSLRNWR